MQSVLCSSIWRIGSLNSEALKRKSLLNTFAYGGLNIVDIRIESLFVKQVLQLIKEHNARWTFLAVYWLGIHVKEHLVLFRLYPP